MSTTLTSVRLAALRRTNSRAAWGPFLILATLLLASCAGRSTPSGAAAPSPSVVRAVPIVNYNYRLGSNRLAAEAAVRVGRWFGSAQYWEVNVRTQPESLLDAYDPAHPEASKADAARVTAANVVLATESGVSIQAFSQAGDGHERQVLSELDAILRQAFPNLATDYMKVFFGEGFQFASATLDHGKLSSFTVKKIGTS